MNNENSENKNNVINLIPVTLNDLLVKLKILSLIERGQKFNVGELNFTNSKSWLGALYRSLHGEGRKSLMLHINQVIQQALNAINEYKDTEFCKIIVNTLAEAKLGINNICETYQNDPNIVSQINVCISNIDLQLEKNSKYLNGHKNNK